MPFHQRLRQLLDENEITQKKLAADLHIAASTVGSYVQGVREPDFSILLRMADYFHVSADYLLDHREETAGPLDRELLRIFYALTDEEQALYLEQGRAFLKVKRRAPQERNQ